MQLVRAIFLFIENILDESPIAENVHQHKLCLEVCYSIFKSLWPVTSRKFKRQIPVIKLQYDVVIQYLCKTGLYFQSVFSFKTNYV